MNQDKIVRELGDLAKTYCEMNRKKYEVKSSIVLDKKNPTDLKKAYLVVMFRDPKKMYRDKEGVYRQDKKWSFSFKTKANCFEMKEFTDYRWAGFCRVKPVQSHKIGWIEGSKERMRFNYFAQKHKICTKIVDSYFQAVEVATARYFENLSGTQPQESKA